MSAGGVGRSSSAAGAVPSPPTGAAPSSPRPPARRSNINPFIVMDVMRAANERAAAGGDVLHLEVGQPAVPAPAGVRAAAAAALQRDRLGYTDALGLPDLRHAIARHYRSAYGVDVTAARIAVTTGSSGAFLLAFLAAFDVGDRVAVAVPGYPCYRNILSAIGVTVVPLATDAASGYQPTPAAIDRIDGRLDGLVIASPANPTGSMVSAGTLAELARAVESRGGVLISDEIYHGITYGAAAATALSASPSVIVVNSFSKYYAMTGWRLGWLVLPEGLVRPVERLAQNLFISPPTLSQHAAIAAFACGDELDGHVRRYARNRERLLATLPAAGFGPFAPAEGAFYLYADIGTLDDDSEALSRRLLREAGVAVTPGTDFDPERGRRFMRFSFAGSEAEITAAGERLVAWRRR
ncbi:MAG: aminotransferase class I/II-fold pyridoxal phosphate-dependent enzyme [Rhodospirillales bacterium]|jgi:aspartate/methionine/tyrosine aminotransferase|nr:aminotransferase class I/II-fold pyridoxal phosphate-dependent enzyme [Rhodospirillales bacterium]